MRSRWIPFLAVFVVLLPQATWGEQKGDTGYRPLRGEYSIYSLELGDPAPPTKSDAKVSFVIKGAAAKAMFQQMGTAATVRDGGCYDSARVKGDLYCSGTEKGEYSCQFGLNLKTGKSINGVIC